MESNPGLDPNVVAAYKMQCSRNPFGFVVHPEEERTPEYAHVYFTGNHDGREVVFDTVLYTLRLEHECEMYSIVEEMTRKKFPEYAIQLSDNAEDTQLPEKVTMHMAEIILSLEEDETVRVKEHADLDLTAGFGIGLDVGLHVEEITDETIAAFIRQFKEGKLTLDPTLYAFQFTDPGDG